MPARPLVNTALMAILSMAAALVPATASAAGVSFSFGFHGGHPGGHHASRHHYGDHARHHGRSHHGYRGGRHHCRKVSKHGYWHGRPARIQGTMCYDRYGNPYIVPGSRSLLDYYHD